MIDNVGPPQSGQVDLDDRLALERLKQRDGDVRRQQAAQMTPGVSAALVYKPGPDGRMYAVEGELTVDARPIPGDPQSTLDRMRAIQRSVRAAGKVSPTARSAAAQADRVAEEASRQIDARQVRAIKSYTENALPEQTRSDSALDSPPGGGETENGSTSDGAGAGQDRVEARALLLEGSEVAAGE